MLAAGKAPEVLDFRAGQTEAWLNPPRGEYQMKLELLSNTEPAKVLAVTPVQKLLVGSSAL
jgi:hypothetical protein